MKQCRVLLFPLNWMLVHNFMNCKISNIVGIMPGFMRFSLLVVNSGVFHAIFRPCACGQVVSQAYSFLCVHQDTWPGSASYSTFIWWTQKVLHLTFHPRVIHRSWFYASLIKASVPKAVIKNCWHTNEAKGSILLCIDPFASYVCLFQQNNIPQ